MKTALIIIAVVITLFLLVFFSLRAYIRNANEQGKEDEKKRKEWERLKNLSDDERAEENRKKVTIRKSIIISNNSEKRTESAAGRAVVGGALFGLTGLIVGTATAKNKNFVTFLVEYEDNHKETYNVEINSPLYKKLIEYVEI